MTTHVYVTKVVTLCLDFSNWCGWKVQTVIATRSYGFANDIDLNDGAAR